MTAKTLLDRPLTVEPITPAQLRMARAGLRLSLRRLASILELSAMALSRYERGDEGVLSVATARRMTDWFVDQGVFFGPFNAVSLKYDVFKSNQHMVVALFKVLEKHGLTPTGKELSLNYEGDL